VVPTGKEPGWIIPDHLRHRWELTIGRSQDRLPTLLGELGKIDLFLHDSEHSYDCMSFEFRTAFGHLRSGGILASDDASWNSAFEDFAASVNRSVQPLGRFVALQK
jgi:predicted O-methyltransferase YrrM